MKKKNSLSLASISDDLRAQFGGQMHMQFYFKITANN